MHLLPIRTVTGPSPLTPRPSLRGRLADPLRLDASACHAVRARLSTLGLEAPADEAAPETIEAVVASVAAALMRRAGLHARSLHAPSGAPVEAGVVATEWAADESEAGARQALNAAVELVAAVADADDAAPGIGEALEAHLDAVRRHASRDTLGPSTRSIVAAAARRGIPWERGDADSLVRLGWGRATRWIRASTTGATSVVAADTASHKALANRLLADALLPVPRGETVRTEVEAVEAAARIGYPVVVKPLDGNHGRGVSVGMTTPEAVREAFETAASYGRRVLVEETFVGRDYRVLVVGGRMVAAAERRPPEVVGDGQQPLAALVDEINRDPRRGDGHERPMTRVRLDAVALAHLAAQGLSPESVLAAGQRVALCRTANLSRGGTAHDVTDRVHPLVAAVCERAARLVGLDVCGVDLVAPGIDQPLPRGSGIVELNAGPGLRMHLAPSEGEPRDVGAAIVDALYPPGEPVRIPLVAVTGTNGKTTVTRLIAHVLGRQGLTVGMTSTSGVWIGGQCVATGDTSGPQSARAVLADPAVEVAVLETARGGLTRRGLGWDGADVAVLTNVAADHLGQDGIETVEDVYRIKRLVAERVRAGGTLVLNADCPYLSALPDDPAMAGTEHQVVWFALAPSPRIEAHLAAGGRAVFVRDGWIVDAAGGTERLVACVASVPLTLGGAATFHVANVLAALGALGALGVPVERAAEGLHTFEPARDNRGRTALFALGEGYVLLDYAHNPDGLAAVGALVAGWRATRPVVGIVGAPGDRDDATLEAVGRAAAEAFSRVVVREDSDRRGRAPGETSARVARGAARHPDVPCAVCLDGLEALRRELDTVQAGAVVVVLYDGLEPYLALLAAHGAAPADAVRDPDTSGDGLSLPVTMVPVPVPVAVPVPVPVSRRPSFPAGRSTAL